MLRKAIIATVIIFAPIAGVARAAQEQSKPNPSAPALAPIRLLVDASHAPQKILHAHLKIPVQPGPLSLYYPEWIPGEHMPDGPIINVAGLKFAAAGITVAWRRDLLDGFTFHLEIPQGATSLEVDLDFLLSAPASGFSSGASATANLDLLSWNQLVLYPAGHNAADLMIEPSLRLPTGWKFGTALPGPKQSGDTVEFSRVSLATLIDSPVISGRYFRAIPLTPGQNPTHEMDIAADAPADLAMPADMEAHFRQLVAEGGALFGSRHYRDYHFLVTLSDQVALFGLEHHESSDDQIAERTLIDQAQRTYFSDLIPHEFMHSWNGKYRRPEGLVSNDYHQPMKDDLLWVYEGLTEYLGEVLTTRSGFWTLPQSQEALADLAATYENRPGRSWRPLQDTADSAEFLYNAGADWGNWRRNTDFYEESELLWLDVDATLRRLTGDKKSLNDFCRDFAGGPGGEPLLKPYNFDDVVATLNGVAPYDWKSFLRTRLDDTAPKTPTEAIENSGWKVVYNDHPNDYEGTVESARKRLGLTFSIGLTVDSDGTVDDVIYDGPAYKAGMAPNMKITAVNGAQYSADELKSAIGASKSATDPIQLIVSNGTRVETYSIDYHGGLRYPHLERDASHPDYLGEILKPLAKVEAAEPKP